ncbi:MAG: pyrroline-5-carboxylate reductase [Planctomycetota bacterium]
MAQPEIPPPTQAMPDALAVIGGGAMAGAILSGAADAAVLPARVCVAEPDGSRRAAFATTVASVVEAVSWLENTEVSPGSGQMLLAVKPQAFPGVVGELADAGCDVGTRTVISILAGTRGATLREGLGGSVRVIRVMPNTPAQIGRGTTAIAVSAGATDADAAFARRLFRGVGSVVVDLEESQMDAFTAVAGSGPAYVFSLAEAMERAGAEVGLPAEHIRAIVAETIAGSAELLSCSSDDPATLRQRVTSKGGTTAAALSVLDEAGVGDAFVRAIEAARDRGRELGG